MGTVAGDRSPRRQEIRELLLRRLIRVQVDEMPYRPPNRRLKKPPRLRGWKSSNSA